MSDTEWMYWASERLDWSEKTHSKELSKGWKYAGHPLWNSIMGRERAWCAMFVNFALNETGYKGNGRADAKSFVKYGSPSDLVYGCIVVIRHASGNHHVCFKGPGDLYLGGNQDNKVSLMKLKPDDQIIAKRWPVRK
jgi:uncharacterized protein (TIGR02594 family)